MTNDVAVFLDLDNLVIGAKQANLTFDINLVLDHIKKITDGRVVLRHAYGAGRQSQGLLQELALAGFIVQSATRTNSYSKNLADMQIVVNAMDTLVDGHQYSTYVVMSGDRDFTPLVQSLRKRGKHVIGVGIKRTTSDSLVELCDEYVFYEDMIPSVELTSVELEQLVRLARDNLLANQDRVRASVFKEQMTSLSDGQIERSLAPQGSFTKFLQRYPLLVSVIQEDSTVYVAAPGARDQLSPLYARYRTALKKQRLRVIPPRERFAILRCLIDILQSHSDLVWHELQKEIHQRLSADEDMDVSKNLINAMLLVSRRAEVIRTSKGKTLSTAPVVLELAGNRAFQEAIVCVDSTYLKAILDLPEIFDYSQASLALYDSEDFVVYLRRLTKA